MNNTSYKNDNYAFYKKSSFSHYEKFCVGVNINKNGVKIINTKSDDDKFLEFTHAEWEAFVLGVKNGEFDINTNRYGCQ